MPAGDTAVPNPLVPTDPRQQPGFYSILWRRLQLQAATWQGGRHPGLAEVQAAATETGAVVPGSRKRCTVSP